MTRLLVRVVAFVLLGLTLVFATFDVSMAAKRECDGDGAPDRARQRREQRQQDREDKRDKRGNPASTSSKSLSESSISAGPASTAAPVIGAQPLDANQAVPVTTPQPVVATTPREPIVTAVASTSEVIDSDNQPRGTYGDKDIKQWLDKNGLSDVKPSDVRDNFNRLKNPSDLNARKNWKLLQDDVGNGEVKELERMMKRNDFKLDSIPVPPVPPAGGRPEPCPPDNKPDPAPIDRHPGQSPPDFGCRRISRLLFTSSNAQSIIRCITRQPNGIGMMMIVART